MQSEYEKKINDFMLSSIQLKSQPKILEFGVRKGISTKKFISICEKNNGHLYSVDVDDCSEISKSKNWTFIKSRDDNFNYLEKRLPKEFDLIFLDSFHNAEHVSKIFYYYYSKLKKGGSFFFDDISWLPYLKDSERDNFNCEINNLETFEKLLNILKVNTIKFDLYFSFIGSGMARIIKLQDNELIKPKKIRTRKLSFKNFFRKIFNIFN